MKKLVCCDIDGTLLTKDLNLTNNNKKAIIKVCDNNIFSIITGRFRAGIKDVLDAIPISIPFACFNGSYIEYNNKVIYNNKINKKLLDSVLFDIKDYNTSPIIFTLDDWYYQEKDYWYDYQIKMCNFDGNMCNLRNILKTDISPYKVLIKDLDTKKIDKINNILKQKYINTLKIVKSAATQIEVLPLNTSKASAIKEMEKYFNINHLDTYAIGDYDNDIEMLEYANTSIAMQNAPSYIKDICTFTTLSNNDDGVAYAINKFILN